MDKLTIISGCLFLAADIFAIASLANPDWINTGESAGIPRLCFAHFENVLLSERLGCRQGAADMLKVLSQLALCDSVKPSMDVTGPVFLHGCLLMILFCMAALIFPIGFYISEVGGQPYKLPNNTVVGSSYVLFVLSIFFTIVGLLFAGKVCLPG
ncbi:modulator of smoothened protein isoform X2 [Cygnus atratus]|uniref:modulator of smoothened protein isoform X2 n=1 Tax=Cygnus atratus TaxID=8868 RepID=UPI0015D65F6D|nr:modulator of smoothened protein isoform X2 [Cygnus atratus]